VCLACLLSLNLTFLYSSEFLSRFSMYESTSEACFNAFLKFLITTALIRGLTSSIRLMYASIRDVEVI
jgi:hypothetical protein